MIKAKIVSAILSTITMLVLNCGPHVIKPNPMVIEPLNFENNPNVINLENISINDALWTEDGLYLLSIPYRKPERMCYRVEVDQKRVVEVADNEKSDVLDLRTKLKPSSDYDGMYMGNVYSIDLKTKVFMVAVNSQQGGLGYLNFKYHHSATSAESLDDDEVLDQVLDKKSTLFSQSFYPNSFPLSLIRKMWYLSPEGKYLIIGNKLINLKTNYVQDIVVGEALDYLVIPDPLWTKVAIIYTFHGFSDVDAIHITDLKL